MLFSGVLGGRKETMESGGELIRDNEEKIFVSVRLRPLNEKEFSNNDVSDWECISDDTIVCKNANFLPSGNSMHSNAYTFGNNIKQDFCLLFYAIQDIDNLNFCVEKCSFMFGIYVDRLFGSDNVLSYAFLVFDIKKK